MNMISLFDGKKALILLLTLFVMSFWLPQAFAEIFSNQSCSSNTTLHEVNSYFFEINGVPSDNVNFTEIKETHCEYGCVQTGTVTAECTPKPIEIGFLLIGVLIVFAIVVLIVMKLAGIL